MNCKAFFLHVSFVFRDPAGCPVTRKNGPAAGENGPAKTETVKPRKKRRYYYSKKKSGGKT